ELTIEAGGLATRTRYEASGASSLGSFETGDRVAQVYSVYAGPALSTHLGAVALKSSYLVGYTKVNTPRITAPGAPSAQGDIFGHSVAQAAQVSAGIAPGTILPIGITASGGYSQEDVSNFDQRVRELRGGVQVTLPVNAEVSLIGDAGYQDVKVSSRDAVRGPGGLPVVGSDGRYVTDKSKPRTIAYDVTGFTWDVGVMWRPSRRTSLSAFVGHRYDSMTYYGSLAYTPNVRNSLNINVFDGVTGFGSTIGDAVRGLPTDFTTERNPFSGDISGCASGSKGGGCVNGALGSLSSAAFRSRGVSAAYSHNAGRLRMGLGAGYSRRTFIGARGTVLEGANGRSDETYYVNAGLSGPIDRLSGFSVAVYDSWFKSGTSPLADVNAVGINAGLSRQFTNRLVGSAAVGLDAINRKVVDDALVATGQLGLRYNF
ncbi:MAG: preprotein translocase subunit YajC, partial [Novosphingobium sp.]